MIEAPRSTADRRHPHPSRRCGVRRRPGLRHRVISCRGRSPFHQHRLCTRSVGIVTALSERHPDIDVALGLHPQLAGQFDVAGLRALERAIEAIRPVAIGETGFDFSRAAPSFEEQQRAFRAQLDLAVASGYPTIIHQRDASDALIAELDTLAEPGTNRASFVRRHTAPRGLGKRSRLLRRHRWTGDPAVVRDVARVACPDPS